MTTQQIFASDIANLPPVGGPGVYLAREHLGTLTLRNTTTRRFKMVDLRIACLLGPLAFFITSTLDFPVHVRTIGSDVEQPMDGPLQTFEIGQPRDLAKDRRMAMHVPLQFDWYPYMTIEADPTGNPSRGTLDVYCYFHRWIPLNSR